MWEETVGLSGGKGKGKGRFGEFENALSGWRRGGASGPYCGRGREGEWRGDGAQSLLNAEGYEARSD